MTAYLRNGWRKTLSQWKLVLLFFGYQLAWGMIIYRMVQETVVPILHRYPGEQWPELSKVFWMEGHFRLLKTDLAFTWLDGFAVLLLLRVLLTPWLDAGLFHVVRQAAAGQTLSGLQLFWEGLKQYGPRFNALYAVQLAITGLPLLWLIPKSGDIAGSRYTLESLVQSLLPWWGGYLIAAAWVGLFFMIWRLALVAGTPMTRVWLKIFKQHVNILIIAAALGAMYVICVLSGAVLAYVAAGLAAVLIHQLRPLLSAIFGIWGICAQHELYADKIET